MSYKVTLLRDSEKIVYNWTVILKCSKRKDNQRPTPSMHYSNTTSYRVFPSRFSFVLDSMIKFAVERPSIWHWCQKWVKWKTCLDFPFRDCTNHIHSYFICWGYCDWCSLCQAIEIRHISTNKYSWPSNLMNKRTQKIKVCPYAKGIISADERSSDFWHSLLK